MKKIRTCFIEITDNTDLDKAEIVNKYIILSGINDKSFIMSKVKAYVIDSSDEDGNLYFEDFEKCFDDDKYMNIYKVTDFTSTVYSFLNGNIAFNTSTVYKNMGDEFFNIPLCVDLNNSIDNGNGSLDVFINLSDSNMVIHMDGFNTDNDSCFDGLNYILTDLEKVSVMIYNLIRILYKKCNKNIMMVKIMVITAIPQLLEQYCKNINIETKQK